VTSELLPNRNKIDGTLAAVMATTELINAAGEELLWRGVFLQEFPHDLLRGGCGRSYHRRSCLLGWAVGGSCWVPVWSARYRRLALGEAEASATAWFYLAIFLRSNCGWVSLRSHMIENVLEIAAPAEKVFDFVVDVLNEPRWNPQMLHAEILIPKLIGVGTTFRVRFGRGVGMG
jgi:hypothetical protein